MTFYYIVIVFSSIFVVMIIIAMVSAAISNKKANNCTLGENSSVIPIGNSSRLKDQIVFKTYDSKVETKYKIMIYENEIYIYQSTSNLEDDRFRIPLSSFKKIEISNFLDSDSGVAFVKFSSSIMMISSKISGSYSAEREIGSEYIFSIYSNREESSVILAKLNRLEKAINDVVAEYTKSGEYAKEQKAIYEVERSDFYTKFKQKYNMDFEEWSRDKEVVHGYASPLGGSLTNEGITLVFFKKNNLICVINTERYNYTVNNTITSLSLSTEEKLLLHTKGELFKEYSDLIKKADFELFDSLLKPIDEIISIKYVEDIQSTHVPGRVSGLDMVINQELFGTAYAMVDAIEKSAGQTYTHDFSYYRILFNKMKIKEMFVGKEMFKMFSFLRDIMLDLEAKSLSPAISYDTKKTKAERIKELNDLLSEQLISQEEYDEAKAKILSE